MPIDHKDKALIQRLIHDTLNQRPSRPQGATTASIVTAGESLNTPQLVVGTVVQPKITTTPMPVGPPGTPNDGDIWIATGVGATGQRWAFQYNAASTSAYKWEFIGGSEVISGATGNKMGGSVYTDIGGPLTLPRSGDWIFRASMWAAGPTSGAATHEIGVGLNSTTTVLGNLAATVSPSASYSFNMSGFTTAAALASGSVMWLNGWSNGAASSVTPALVDFSVLPVRVS